MSHPPTSRTAVKTWSQYAIEFRRTALARGLPRKYVSRCLTYAKPIYLSGLPVIYTQEHLSALVGVHIDYLRKAANAPEKFYRTFEIPKRTGGVRTIAEPLPTLKEAQRWILDHVLSGLPISRYAKGFIVGESIRSNARFHRAQDTVIRIDLRDFFGTVRYPVVFALTRQLGYTKAVSTMIARLCTLHGELPQGAPTSPSYANAAAHRLDLRVAAYCRKRRLRYTRYADDITISGTASPGWIISTVSEIVSSEGFTVNERKTRIMRSHQRQLVTGVVVNAHLQAPRELRRNLRQTIHFIERFGVDGHLVNTQERRPNIVGHLRGMAAHILHLNPSDRDALHALDVLTTLTAGKRAPGSD